MTNDAVKLGPATCDNQVDDKISECLDPKSPKSFFLYAGAGSGKTRSLDTALKAFRKKHGSGFRKSGQKIAVITYTNAACDEIASRVGRDTLFNISTIHSFCWSQICSFHADIQEWLKVVIPDEIAELKELKAKGRAGTKAALDRDRAIAAKTRRLEWLSTPRRFTYTPSGDNFGVASVSHSEVLKITAHFIQTKPSMQAVLINQFPFLLIDESQDTNKYLMDAFFALEAEHHDKFALGLFGDMMQRIYLDGKRDLGKHVPDRWEKPVKQMNHRSSQRIVQIGNALRLPVDRQQQMARDDSDKGTVRLFIARADAVDKSALELQARMKMAEVTGDTDWTGAGLAVKSLTLEHHMAALRMGFADLFAALDRDSRLSTGLRSGDLAGVRLFSERVMPLIVASVRQDDFAVMALLRNTSPLLKRQMLKKTNDTADPLSAVREAVTSLLSIDVDDPETTFLDVLKCVAAHGLFDVPDSLKPFVEVIDLKGGEVEDAEEEVVDAEEEVVDAEEGEGEEDDPGISPGSLGSWRAFLETPYYPIVPYADYVADKGAFDTHQGVKGREFDRVFVVMDDSEARGFMFSYEKLLGAKPLSTGDVTKAAQGEEIGVDRTRRLLYVTCTRAEKSLALIAYTRDPAQLERAVIEQGWFEAPEIEHL